MVPPFFRLVHHVQRKHHGNAQFHNLHGEVHIAFNVGAVDDVDNAIWLRFEKESRVTISSFEYGESE